VVTLSLNFFPGKAVEIKEKGFAKTITPWREFSALGVYTVILR
jgi:hypothetical protein